MIRILTILISTLISLSVSAQYDWQWEELSPMPMAITNNAVAAAEAFGSTFIYSFGGIDSTKIWSGISNSSFRYSILTDSWEAIEDLPNSTPVIAAGASTVNGKIYIIGGYTVAQNGSETSIHDVHIFDPEVNSYIDPGMNIPVGIDDQVQCVYKDSLIFVVTGWSNNTNVNNVQIYDTYNDQWLVGTALLNNNDYRAFGASGEIIGDTLYYIGGARNGTNFPLGTLLRKGYINPDDPTDITWSVETMIDEALGYRMAVARWQDRIFWFGGASISYNYDGIAYNGTGGVPPENRIIQYTTTSGLEIISDAMPYLMDMRGLGQVAENEFYLAGGMIENQVVSNKLFKLSYVDTTTSFIATDNIENPLQVFPNPAQGYFQTTRPNKSSSLILTSSSGQTYSINKTDSSYILPSYIPNGLYYIKLNNQIVKLNILR